MNLNLKVLKGLAETVHELVAHFFVHDVVALNT
jgi:hypothetical protein